MLDNIVAALGASGELESFLKIIAAPAAYQQFHALVKNEIKASGNDDAVTLRLSTWVRHFLQDRSKSDTENRIGESKTQEAASSMEQWHDAWKERLKDVAAFDSILKENPEIQSRLSAQGIDLEAEKKNERERLQHSNPTISNEEADVRSALTIYLRHQDAIYRAIPDGKGHKELDAGFDKLKLAAREVGMPYQESVRTAGDISYSDKRAILAATTATSPNAKTIRT